jgi:hypothetical protein
MDDSRIRHAKALVDDARTILSEIADEITDNTLEAARFSLNVSIQHLNILEASLMRCATCGHPPWVHGRSGPTAPCEICIRCQDSRCRCASRDRCPCLGFVDQEAS